MPLPHFSLSKKAAMVVTGDDLCYLRFVRYGSIFLHCLELNFCKKSTPVKNGDLLLIAEKAGCAIPDEDDYLSS